MDQHSLSSKAAAKALDKERQNRSMDGHFKDLHKMDSSVKHCATKQANSPASEVIEIDQSDEDSDLTPPPRPVAKKQKKKTTTNHVVTPAAQRKRAPAGTNYNSRATNNGREWPAPNYQEQRNPRNITIDGVPAQHWQPPVITGGFYQERGHRPPGRNDGWESFH